VKDCSEQVAGFERAAVRMSKDDRADIFGKAKINRDRLKSGLERNGSPKAIGSRTQGSYAMRTMIQHDRGNYDVDDGVYFKRDSLKNDQGEDKSPEDVRKMVSDALQDKRFADQPEPRNNCVRVYYKQEGYHVDVPIYRENRTTDPFTGVEKKWFEIAAGDKWRTSDPLANTKWFKDENDSKSPDATADGNDGQFRADRPPGEGFRPQPLRLVEQDLERLRDLEARLRQLREGRRTRRPGFPADNEQHQLHFEPERRHPASGAGREHRGIRRREDRIPQGEDRREPEASRRARQARLHAR